MPSDTIEHRALEPKTCPNLSTYRAMEYQLERIRLRYPVVAKGKIQHLSVDESTHLDMMDRQWAKLTPAQKKQLSQECP